MQSIKNLQNRYSGSHISKVPEASGIYAWYFSPCSYSDNSMSSWTSVIKSQTYPVNLSVKLRYGTKLKVHAFPHLSLGSNEKNIDDIINEPEEKMDALFRGIIELGATPLFTRPLYIGIAKNFKTRVYKQHYQKLIELWDSTSSVSRLINSSPSPLSIDEVIKRTGEKHSFALEARLSGIAARDLTVFLLDEKSLSNIQDDDTDIEDTSESRRKIESFLQLLTDPVFGRN